jgi:glutamine---fructose-6-phosphate transaminase (isomerizing)
MKHGPIVRIDESMPVVFLALTDAVYAKARSKHAGGEGAGAGGSSRSRGMASWRAWWSRQLCIPTAPLLSPVLTTIPLESWPTTSRYCAAATWTGPGNLTKSVTVK